MKNIKLLKPSGVFFPQLQSPAATQRRFAFPRRFGLLLASGALAGVGGGDLAESAEDLYNPY